jgi:hypothetical protein
VCFARCVDAGRSIALVCVVLVTCTGGRASYPPPCSARRSDECSTPSASPALSCVPSQRIADALPRLRGFDPMACGKRGFVLLGPGEEEASPEDLGALQSAFGLDVFALPGVQNAGRGLCCYPDPEPVTGGCVAIAVDQCGSSLDRIAAFVDQRAHALGLEHKRLRVAVRMTGFGGARCAAGAPGCGPIPLSDHAGAAYAPDAERVPLHELRGGACGHDGDCLLGGWGDECRSWTDPVIESIGNNDKRLRSAFCGCVAGHCAWFEQ